LKNGSITTRETAPLEEPELKLFLEELLLEINISDICTYTTHLLMTDLEISFFVFVNMVEQVGLGHSTDIIYAPVSTHV